MPELLYVGYKWFVHRMALQKKKKMPLKFCKYCATVVVLPISLTSSASEVLD